MFPCPGLNSASGHMVTFKRGKVTNHAFPEWGCLGKDLGVDEQDSHLEIIDGAANYSPMLAVLCKSLEPSLISSYFARKM